MKIVLVEERNGLPQPEREFTSEVVKVGRDGLECHLVFDQSEWPMVSRRHAEFRLQDGRCSLVDTNSKFGTFLDGQRVVGPGEVRVGTRVQFGAGGPVVRVAGIEQSPQAAPPIAPLHERETEHDVPVTPEAPRDRIPPPVIPSPPIVNRELRPSGPERAAALPPPSLELTESESGRTRRIPLNKDVIRIGRDPDLDVVIDAAAAVVSRRHAEVRKLGGQWVVVDQGSFNGTLINDFRITQPTPVFDGDRIQLGIGGPLLRLLDQSRPAAGGKPPDPLAGVVAPIGTGPFPQLREMAGPRPKTIVVPGGSGALQPQMSGRGAPQPQLLFQRSFDHGAALSIGRAPDSDIHLDGLTISNHHARVFLQGGTLFIEDAGSTNGVYVNGVRISGKQALRDQEIIQIGPFVLQAHPQRGVAVFDTRSKTRIDAIDITKVVRNRSGKGEIKLLDDVDLTVLPNEFVGLLGPSGAGKSTLMDSLNGMRPATNGQVLINSLDLYRHLNSLKQSIGYVPQEDIIHRELTVYRTLYYVARLRLSSDVSTSEIDQIVNEVMDVTGLAERRDVPVAQLSGGQRKRVSIAVELITKPSVIFLDEPTSGLDPATEEKIMKLFRQIAESGRTVILTTHAMENVKLFDKIVVMMRGKLVFYGQPQEALAHVGAESFKDLYDRLEAPIGERIAQLAPLPPNATKEQKSAFKLRREQIAEEVAEEWRQRFQRTAIYQQNVVQPLSGLRPDIPPAALAKQRPTVTDAVRQWGTLSRRYAEVLLHDKLNLLILLGQPPIIAFLTYLVIGEKNPRDFAYFVPALVAVWFGTSLAAREIIRERAVYNRERMVNLGLLPYVGSKLFVLTVIIGFQCATLFGALKLFHYTGLMKFQGWAAPQLAVMILTGIVGLALGLLISAIVKTSEMATSLVPLILIPQILFSGLVGVPAGFSKIIGVAMPATWSFDEMKRLSGLDTVREEGSDPSGKTSGRGLYKYYEDLNDKNIAKAQGDVENYKKKSEDKSKAYERQMKDYVEKLQSGRSATQPTAPKLDPPPTVPAAEKVPENLSEYVDFLHPWGNVFTDPAVLFVMFLVLFSATLLTLRAQDIG